MQPLVHLSTLAQHTPGLGCIQQPLRSVSMHLKLRGCFMCHTQRVSESANMIAQLGVLKLQVHRGRIYWHACSNRSNAQTFQLSV
jgi:hypothetical protein